MSNDIADSAAETSDIDYSYHYRKWHDDSEDHFQKMTNYFARKLEPFLPQDRSARIFEVGSGTGFGVGGLQILGYQNVEGIDADKQQVAFAQRRELPVKYVPTDHTKEYLKINAERYDAVLCIDVLEHIPIAAQLTFLKSLREALKPAGRIICQVPNANSGIASRYRYIDWTHQCSFSEISLDFVLHSAGFHVDNIVEIDGKKRPPFPHLLRPRLLASWLIYKLFRTMRRLEFMAELGEKEGRAIPLTPNILAVATKI
jgi:2-polyprenyl-3-methyl-5-hydroxy-6-metoxy-1,4-benzoquinol methylase